MSLHDALLVNLLFGTGLVLFLRACPVRRTWARILAVLLITGLTANYVAWRVRCMPFLAPSLGALWPWAFFLCEATTVAYEAWSNLVMVRITNHTPEADRYEPLLRRRKDLPTVDVFIATFMEPVEILDLTIRAALRLDYPRHLLRIHVLDDGGTEARRNHPDPKTRAEARDRARRLAGLCAELGVNYIARLKNDHAKAGNQQYAFERTDGQYLLMLDADFLVHPNLLFRVLGFLLYRRDVGLVQVPQCFRNSDVIGHNLLAGDCVPEEQHFFMTVTQPCRDAWGNAFCVGTGCVVPRTLLRRIGGFPRSTICEDLELTYTLLSAGYRTLYLNEALAFGLAPESIIEYVKQRIRWCAGTIQHLFVATGPLRGRYKLLDRVFYLEGFFYWFGFLFVTLLVLAPIVFWFTGVPAIAGAPEEALAILLPRLVARALVIYWLSEGKVPPVIVNVSKLLPAFHLSATIVKSLVSPFSATFKVTDKGLARGSVVIRWPMFLTFLSVAGLTLFGMLANLTGLYVLVPFNDMMPLNVTWTVFSSLVCVATALACVERPQSQDYLRTGGGVTRGAPAKILSALVRRLLGLT